MFELWNFRYYVVVVWVVVLLSTWHRVQWLCWIFSRCPGVWAICWRNVFWADPIVWSSQEGMSLWQVSAASASWRNKRLPHCLCIAGITNSPSWCYLKKTHFGFGSQLENKYHACNCPSHVFCIHSLQSYLFLHQQLIEGPWVTIPHWFKAVGMSKYQNGK